MKPRALLLAAVLIVAASPAGAQLAPLATAPGDGGVSFQVDAYGGFGYQTYGGGQRGPGDALYDPVGAVGPSSTTWQSAVYLRMVPLSTFLTTGSVGSGVRKGNLPDPGFLFQDGTTATSAFSVAGLDWQLTQSVQDIVVGASRLGTLLVQDYVIQNNGAVPRSFDLVRYHEGDLYLGLGAGVPDGGGRLDVGTEELLFETDKAGEPADTTNLVGITACGGVKPSVGRYEVNAWPAFPNRITADEPLGDVVFNDGADFDEFADAGLDYDVGIALANQFTLAPGQVGHYVTTTVFGLLPPEDVTQGCALRAGAVADAGVDQSACPGVPITLDGRASFDPDVMDGGRTPSWTWDLDVATDSDANTVPDDDVDATGSTVVAFFSLGTTTAQLTFADDDGDRDTDIVRITIEDDVAPVVACAAELVVPATSFAGGPAAPMATATDNCEASPPLANDRTPGGGDASDDYPCGATLVTFTAHDAAGNVGSCTTLVRVVPDVDLVGVGAALRVSKLALERAVLDWSLAGPPPSDVRFAVLRGTLREAPRNVAPGGRDLAVPTWTDDDLAAPLVFYDVRTIACDGSLSEE